MCKKRYYSLIILLFSLSLLTAQQPKQKTSGEIYHAIEKLNFLGTALYIAAHPDDENTRLISYISNELKANTAYLSLTRGGGGQNMIGTEISDLLGVLRTNELLAARSKDGGKQFFTRAVDFGYSKHPDETLEVWEKDKVLADVIWVIRNFKPDVIINRFDHRRAGRTHGHHTSSALLSIEAYDMTNDPQVYPEQLEFTDLWQPKRVFYNTSWWAFGGREKFAKADKSHLMALDVGVFYPLLGKSNTEIAAEARSMHKCQGFGSAGSRGSISEYLETIKGDVPLDKSNIFDGINTSWTRVDGGKIVGDKIETLLETFNFKNPADALGDLLEIKSLIAKTKNPHWRDIKSKEIDQIIADVLGLYVVAIADEQTVSNGSAVDLSFEFTNRSANELVLTALKVEPNVFDSSFHQTLAPNEANKYFKKVTIPHQLSFSSPYWLTQEKTKGCYAVEDQEDIGKALGDRSFTASFYFDVMGSELIIEKDIVHSFTDRTQGEVFQPFEITPEVFVNIKDELYLFGNDEPQEVEVVVKSGKHSVEGTLQLAMGDGWEVSPSDIEFEIQQKGDSRTFNFEVTPPMNQSIDDLRAEVMVEGRKYTSAVSIIDYEHIPLQTVLAPSKSKAVRVDLIKHSKLIGYIEGAGDKMQSILKQVGYQVEEIDIHSISASSLEKYDAVVVGIRALNVKEELKYKTEALNAYVENGGTLVYQYNTTRGLKVKDFAPYPLKLSRDRVTVEESPVQLLEKDHQVLNFPNKISLKDFDGWIQERGLYFPSEWDDKYIPILGMHDPGQEMTKGSLLIANHGYGHFVYSGISWFRELPAGVPGAIRLFANILDLKHGKA